MSEQCAICLSWLRETSDNGTDTYACDKCEWLAPWAMTISGLGVMPKPEYLDWAKKYYYMDKMYHQHMIPDDDEAGWFKIKKCEMMREEETDETE